ncbi:hypothetical protein HMF8227_01513 [Saliniradius amylolyticus]|uniref:DUF4127 family protein n=1 Tax=Saliniradius amylolyticus TaxID=2183582 RepID=A0A2S2E2W5_9ALTE|nr:DUF4127 family protein [Saliniradius amylolyticus]AWL11988.1 hypothetical protein HMF8227_01513 [Saliniradius amylolyticus]
MTRATILALPVDGRPVTREQLGLLARAADCELLLPEVDALGFFREPADRKQLHQWIHQQASKADGFILSLDMLVYGGLVPSRFIEDDLDSLREWLELLKDLKQHYPDKPLYGFCATMRMSNNNENEEEKLYWADYGTDIWEWSFYSDRFDCLADSEDKTRAEAAKARIPKAIREDYLATRRRNLAITEQILDWVDDGIIDRLILPQDDTAEYGFNIAERRHWQQQVASRGLSQNVAIYAGADEVAATLLACQLQQLGVVEKTRLAIDPHHADSLSQMVARYEDRPVVDSLQGQIAAAGAELVSSPDDADAIIAVHCQGHQQGDWALGYPLPESLPHDPEWLERIANVDKPVGLLDLAYANGGDPELIQALDAKLNQFSAYGAWNTASNSIGFLVTQLCLAKKPDAAANRHLLAIRLLDDYLYQARLRQHLRRQLTGTESASELTALARKTYLSVARQWLADHGLEDIQLDDVYLPWQRSFEIGLVTKIAQGATS